MQPYEARFAKIVGSDYVAFGFWKARVALYAILKALEVKENDEIILPGYTCVVVPNSIRYAGAKPIYADIRRDSYNIDPASVEARITAKTRVIIAQHTYGLPADMAALKAIAERRGLFLIEDCAHVLLHSSFQGKPLGSLSHAAFFSFQWSKPYTTGLGGMAVTRDPALADKLERIQAEFRLPSRPKSLQLQLQYSLFRRFFKPQFYWWGQASLRMLSGVGLFVGSSNLKELLGEQPSDFAWRMSRFQHRVGLQEITKIQENSAHRDTLTKYYLAALRRANWPTYGQGDRELDGTKFLRLPLAVERKRMLLSKAKRAGIEIGSWFESPLHPLKLSEHKALNYIPGTCPIAESAAQHVINLPLHHRVTHDDAEKIVQFLISNAVPANMNSN